MDEAKESEKLDPLTSKPRTLMQMLLPLARSEYIKAWTLLSDPSTPLERRRLARKRASTIAQDHAVIATALRTRESKLSGDDLLNTRHLASELERHAGAMERIATISPLGLQNSKELRPESLGCGKRYRDPATSKKDKTTPPLEGNHPRSGKGGTKGAARSGKPRHHGSAEREKDDRYRAPKAPRSALGTSKHDSSLGDDLDEQTRAKLEALRNQLDS